MADTVPGAAPVIDQRTSPRGVLPRSTQTWLMAGLAVGVLGIIVFAGHQEPAARPAGPVTVAQPREGIVYGLVRRLFFLIAPERIHTLVNRAGAPVRDVCSLDFSRRTAEANAAVIGLTIGRSPAAGSAICGIRG